MDWKTWLAAYGGTSFWCQISFMRAEQHKSGLAVPLGYQAACVAFQRIFSSFNNHDTVAPWLLAAPVGLIVFMLVSGIAFALVAILVGYLLPRFRKQPRNDPSRAMSAGQTGNRASGEKDRSP